MTSPPAATDAAYLHLLGRPLDDPPTTSTRQQLRDRAREASNQQCLRGPAARMLHDPEVRQAGDRLSKPGRTPDAPRRMTRQAARDFVKWLERRERKKLDRMRAELQHLGREIAETQMARRHVTSAPVAPAQQGHAPRKATNTKTKGSRRGSGSNPPRSSGNDDPDLDGESDESPRRGRLHAAPDRGSPMSGTTVRVVCKLSGCRDTFSRNGGPGCPRDYCDRHSNPNHPERTAERKARQRGVAYNTLTRGGTAGLPLPERAKRKTSTTHDADGNHEDDLHLEITAKPTSRWDEIAKAWQGANTWRPSWLAANRGIPAVDERGRRITKLVAVDRLMAEAERNVRRLDKSAGTPVGFLREQDSRTAEWIDEQDKGRTRTILYSREDAGSPGDLWLKGKHEAAISKANGERDYKLRWCESRSGGYLKGGEPWFTTPTPHGCAAMYAKPKPSAMMLGGHESFDYDDLTPERHGIEDLMQSNGGAF